MLVVLRSLAASLGSGLDPVSTAHKKIRYAAQRTDFVMRSGDDVRADDVRKLEIEMKRLAMLLLTLPLFACDRDGPLERIGEEIDEAAEDIRAGGETTGNQIDDAIDDVQDDLRRD